MNFSTALELIKKYKRVQRTGWNGKGMFLFLVSDWGSNDTSQISSYHLPFIAMKTADDKVVPWLASQTDILAEDWQIES